MLLFLSPSALFPNTNIPSDYFVFNFFLHFNRHFVYFNCCLLWIFRSLLHLDFYQKIRLGNQKNNRNTIIVNVTWKKFNIKLLLLLLWFHVLRSEKWLNERMIESKRAIHAAYFEKECVSWVNDTTLQHYFVDSSQLGAYWMVFTVHTKISNEM